MFLDPSFPKDLWICGCLSTLGRFTHSPIFRKITAKCERTQKNIFIWWWMWIYGSFLAHSWAHFHLPILQLKVFFLHGSNFTQPLPAFCQSTEKLSLLPKVRFSSGLKGGVMVRCSCQSGNWWWDRRIPKRFLSGVWDVFKVGSGISQEK